ncbi:phytanoyl-CoA dioxygenase family protein [Stratiformator vulcanicus]|uniref:Phytanoyl-CoA dioxygenase (PhyH) n=1 Tax=Stratiformator vulcanicus TaxID=2527980 RepID=A0A517R465_9PLAN|nr:phytanoyl-CoA dioxygenase family protein [Stratiformator vulcanicus]QDT38668.1 Phytanoyl-CoA dioxygenase (PhyH) [Stratiformator vulcanicus]
MASDKEFKAVPDGDALATMERDLRFHKIRNDDPTVLSEDQIERFNREGYLRPFRVFGENEISEIRSYFDELLQKYLAEGKDSYSISTAHLKHGRVYDILKKPEIVALVKDLLGDDVVGWGSHFFCKMPHDGKSVAWHQDASYWPLSPSKAVTVWLAIDDADAGNANMRFIAGSHHYGHMTFRPSGSHEQNVLNQTIDHPEQYGTPVDDPLLAGECSIHSDLLLHGSEANESDRRRCALTLRYAAADVRAGMDWNEKGVIVSGSDPSGHWKNPPRPDAE